MARQTSITEDDLEFMLINKDAEPKPLPYSLLEKITNGFSEAHIIGRGGFAYVYKGSIGNRSIAVKRLLPSVSCSHEKKFIGEIECLMKVKHINVVRFIGYCCDTQGYVAKYEDKHVIAESQERLICFEFLPACLDNYIKDPSCPLEWRQRYQIINGVCQGLHQLHEHEILHLDLKPRNILLDDDMIPKISGFGNSRCLEKNQDYDYTETIMGTWGYISPETIDNGLITKTSDLFSLGVTIIEIMTGNKEDIKQATVENVFVSCIQMLDDKSLTDAQKEQIMVCAEIGIECSNIEPDKRPSNTKEIIDRLEKTASTQIKVRGDRSPSLPLQKAIEGEPLDGFGKRPYTEAGTGGRREGTVVGRGLMEAVSSSTGAMGPLLRKLELLLAPESRLRKRVKDGIGLLKEDLEEVSSPLVDLSMLETPSPRAKCWMEEARELSYHVEDFVDELMLMLTDAGANIRVVSRHRVGRVKIALLPAPPRRSTRVTKIAELRALVWQATERLERYQLEACCSSPSDINMITQHRWAPALYGDAANLVGIEACRIKLIEILTGEAEQQPKVAFIVGPAGVGKTTLAKEIFGELRGKFELRAFVHASRKLDMRRLLGSILSQVQPHHQRPSVAGTVQSLIDSIQEQLRDKRYFIVIDDLWEETAWDIVRDAFPEGNNYSRIVATTENMNVALKCCGYMTDNILKMKPLGIQDSEYLFFNRVFGSDQQCPDELKEVSYGIIRKCCGLPLSIIHVAGLLASMDYSGLWYHVHDRLCSILNRSHTIEEIQEKILNLSYNSLPHCLKTCLLYFNMYPESYIMWKVHLVKQWIAEGFINPAEGEDREEIAEGYFEELVNRGMVQPMKIDHNGEVLSCTVHHTIFDVINHNSKEEEFIAAIDYSQPITGLSTKARRLSFRFSSAKYAKQPARTTMSQLRSLGFFGFGKCMPPIVEFKHLRVLVLDFWGSHDGHTSLNLSRIYILFQLRYLKISGDIMVELPAKMQGLHYLETLEIDARLSAVPLDIVHLPSLFHLSLRAATKLPDGIGHIKSLNTLLYFDLRCNSEDNIRSLGQLTNLRHLHLTCSAVLSSDHLKRKLIPLAFSLGKLGNLKSLTLFPGALRTTIVFDILSGISSPSIFLQRLELLPPFCFFSSLPTRFGELHKLRILKIVVKELQENDINNIAGLPSLVIFSLYVRTALTGTVIFGTMAFPALKYFRFTCGVTCLAFQVGAMHNLQRLKLCFNAHGGENHSRVIDGIEYLLNLQEVSGRIGVLPGGDESNMRVVKLSFEDTIRKHPRCLRFNLQLVDFIEEEYPPLVKLHQRQQDEYEIEEKDCAEDNNKHTHSRSYYRCTYRQEQGCKATKTVQQSNRYDVEHHLQSVDGDSAPSSCALESYYGHGRPPRRAAYHYIKKGKKAEKRTQNTILDQESLRLSYKEQKRVVGKHILRPLSGASPFTICNSCFNLVQMPSDVYISKAKVGKMQCGMCSKVLSLSFRAAYNANAKSGVDVAQESCNLDDSIVTKNEDIVVVLEK